MKIMVAIVNYGLKNAEYAKQLIQEYRSMPFEVDIFVLSESPKDYGSNVTVLVGLPEKDPWSLPFAHKKLFADNINSYDLFIYTEDDFLIRKDNIMAFLSASEKIGDCFLPGFVQYELYPDGKKNYPQVHGSYHWVPDSVRSVGEYLFAEFSNVHSACYILTKAQLHKALVSGGFLVPPHSGRYDLLCSAATDPYTQCGFTKVICFSHLRDFELHHLPNRYLNHTGLYEDGYQLQIAALNDVFGQNRSTRELFVTEKPMTTQAWDKNYYEPCRVDIVSLIPFEAKEILSFGCGWGATEAHLQGQGKRVVAIPLDSIIGRLAEERGISVLPPDFDQALELLCGRKFDAVILPDVLQHLPDPIETLKKLSTLLRMGGILVGSTPNLSQVRRIYGKWFVKNNKWSEVGVCFDNTQLNLTSASAIKNWLEASSFRLRELRYEDYAKFQLLPALGHCLPGEFTASKIVFVSEWMNP